MTDERRGLTFLLKDLALKLAPAVEQCWEKYGFSFGAWE